MSISLEKRSANIAVSDIISIKGAADRLRMSVEGVWYHIGKGRLRLIKIGKRSYVLKKQVTGLKRTGIKVDK